MLSPDAGGVQICANIETDVESEARHVTGNLARSDFLGIDFVTFASQLYVLKLLKMQTKYLGRQWRKSNMKTMSAIYTKVTS